MSLENFQRKMNSVKDTRAFPLRALAERLRNASEMPSWASYLDVEVSRPEESASPAQPKAAGPLPNLLGGKSRRAEGSSKAQAGESVTAPLISAGNTNVRGQVWKLSQDSKGCREVQLAIENCAEDREREVIALELKGHVLEAMRCPHANHVLQKLITSTRPGALQFILDEFLEMPGSVELAARHKYGCRIIQRLMEHCLSSQVSALADNLLNDVTGIARHPYGNYVLQNLLEHGTSEKKHKLAEVLRTEVGLIGQDTFGSAVVSSALSKLSKGDSLMLARAIVQERGLLILMANSRHGHTAVRQVLQVLEGADLAKAKELLLAEMTSLKVSRYGRAVASWLENGR